MYPNESKCDCAGQAPTKMPEETLVSILSELGDILHTIKSTSEEINGKMFGIPVQSNECTGSGVAREPRIRDIARDYRRIARDARDILEQIRSNF